MTYIGCSCTGNIYEWDRSICSMFTDCIAATQINKIYAGKPGAIIWKLLFGLTEDVLFFTDSGNGGIYKVIRNTVNTWNTVAVNVDEYTSTGGLSGIQLVQPLDFVFNIGKTLIYVAEVSTGTIYSVAVTGGTTIPILAHNSFNQPSGVTIDPTGQYLYVVDATATDLYQIDLSSPSIVPVFGASTFIQPKQVFAAPNGLVYVADAGTGAGDGRKKETK